MNRRWIVVVGVVLATAVGPSGRHPADAQFSDHLDLVAQTIFVADQPVVLDLQVPGTGAERQLDVRVHAPLTDPDLLRDAFDDAPTGNIISQFTLTDLQNETVGVGGIVSVTLPEEEIGEILRAAPGVLPIVIELRAGDRLIDTLVTGVIVEDDTDGAPVKIGFVTDARSPLAHRPDGTVDIDPGTVLGRVRTAVEEAPSGTLVQLGPETLTALAHTDVDGGLTALDDIRHLLEDHHVDTRPWVELDVEAWRRAGEVTRVLAQYTAGAGALETYLGRSPEPIAFVGPTAGPETLGLLRSTGVTAGLIEADRVDAADLARADRRPMRVRDSNGIDFTVLPIDRAFGDELEGNDPELVGLRLFLRLLLEARAASTERAIVLDLSTVDQASLDVLRTLAGQTARISTAEIGQLLDIPAARDASGALLRVELSTDGPIEVGAGASDIRLTESVLTSFVGMVDAGTGPIEELRTRLAAAMSSELDDTTRRRYTDAVFATVVDGTSGFAVLEGERVTLATRQADLSVVLHNDQTFPTNVVVRFTSEKLRLPEGDVRTLTLPPGETTIEIPVETVISGDARILIQVTSPDGLLDLASGAINVRSTAISGLGLAVSLASLLILLTWWARTVRRVRRSRRAASVSENSAAVSGRGSAEGPSSSEDQTT